MLRGSSVLGTIACVPSALVAWKAEMPAVLVLDCVSLAIVLAITFLRRIPLRVRAAVISVVFYALGVGLMIGIGAIGQTYLLGFSVMTTLLVGVRWGRRTIVLNFVTMLVMGWQGLAKEPIFGPAWAMKHTGWLIVTLNFVLVNTSILLALGAVLHALDRRHDEILRAQAFEERLRQTQRLETLGSLAGGVAHDMNNLMSVVLSYSEVLAEELDEPARTDLLEIHRAGQRAVGLTRQLLAFSRQQVLAPKVVDLSEICGGMETMLRRLIGEDVELVVSCGGGKVLVDPGQIEQVIMNLVVNARDAMPTGGRITVTIADVELEDDTAAGLATSPGPRVMISVRDTGTGMDAETQAHIFEPFFTTKEQGKGTGLGLAMVFGVVRQSGGSVAVTSAPGAGTTMKVFLPRAACDAVEAAGPVSGPPPTLRGTETILLVEDEEGVRTLARTILRKYGYDVLEAQNGGDALLLCEQHRGTIDLLLTDVVMPRTSGRQLAERLHLIRPAMKVLFMSGYTNDAIVRHGVHDSTIAFYQKPVLPEPLVRKVREVLEA